MINWKSIQILPPANVTVHYWIGVPITSHSPYHDSRPDPFIMWGQNSNYIPPGCTHWGHAEYRKPDGETLTACPDCEIGFINGHHCKRCKATKMIPAIGVIYT